VAKELLRKLHTVENLPKNEELLAIATIGTIADMVPLVGANRSIAKFGLEALNETDNPGFNALFELAGLTKGQIKTYDVSFILAPRLNAVGRIIHALDALRLLVTSNKDKARELARKLNDTNRERQLITEQHLQHAMSEVENQKLTKFKLLIVEHDTYNLGVIGLVAGKLVEQYYRPAIVLSIGEKYAKASARSIKGFDIIKNIRTFSDYLVDAGGHPMAAGFTVDITKLTDFKKALLKHAESAITSEMLVKELVIDAELPAKIITESLLSEIQKLEPFGMANPEPVFVLKGAELVDAYCVGKEKQHLKLRLTKDGHYFSAIGFNMGERLENLSPDTKIDIAFSLLLDTFNGRSNLQLKLKDLGI
jgi:single-stranded-DNA-specific exonuclease